MQAFSPAPKSNEKFIASASPRKKKFQAQLASPSPQLADSERKNEMNRGGIAMTVDNILAEISFREENQVPYGQGISPVIAKRERDVLTEKIHLLEKELRATQQAHREISMKRVFEEEAFKQTLKNERMKLEKMITSLSAKLRDRNEIITDWIAFVLNQPQFMNASTFFQSEQLLQIMHKTVQVLPKLKPILKPTMDSINEFDRKSRESSTNANALRKDGELLGEDETNMDSFPIRDFQDGEPAQRSRKRPKKKDESAILSSLTAAIDPTTMDLISDSDKEKADPKARSAGVNDSDAEELLSAIDEQMKMINHMTKEKTGRPTDGHVEGSLVKGVAFQEKNKEAGSGKKKKKKLSKKAVRGGSNNKEESEDDDREEVSAKELKKLLYESKVMHNNILQLSKEQEDSQYAQKQQEQFQRNLFSTLFRETPNVSVDGLVVKDEHEMHEPQNGVEEKKQDQTDDEEIANQPPVERVVEDDLNKNAAEMLQRIPSKATKEDEELLPPQLPISTDYSPHTNQKMNIIDEYLQTIDSEDVSYDEVLRDIFDSVSGLSQSLDGLDQETNQLISQTSASPKHQKKSKKKTDKVRKARDSDVILNTKLPSPQDLMQKIHAQAPAPSDPAPRAQLPAAQRDPPASSQSTQPAPAMSRSEPAARERPHRSDPQPAPPAETAGGGKKPKKKVSIKSKDGTEDFNFPDHESLLKSTNQLIENIQHMIHSQDGQPPQPQSKVVSVDSLPAEYGKESGPVRDAESIGTELKLGGQLDNDP